MDMDISMDIHAKSVDMDMDMDVKFHIHGNPGSSSVEFGNTGWSKKVAHFWYLIFLRY